MRPLPDLSLYPPRTAARISKAIDLAQSGAVTTNGSGYYVRSQSGPRLYHVDADTGCNCPDARYNPNLLMGPDGHFRPGCKHQIAVWYYLYRQPPSWPNNPHARY